MTVFTVRCGSETHHYVHKRDHRDKTAGKSQWDISEADELSSFTVAMSSGWVNASYAWGIHKPNGVPKYLGRDRDHSTQLFIARFESKKEPFVWHGYPVNHKETGQRPATTVLKLWIEKSVLPRTKISKIERGVKCTL